MSELARLHDENKALHARLSDFEHLTTIFKSLSSTLQVDQLLELIITESVKLCHASQGSIVLFDPQNKKMAKTLIKSGKIEERRIDHYLNNILAGWVYDHKQILQSNQLIKTFNENIIIEKYRDIRSVLCVPITNQAEMLGVINLISLDQEYLFSGREIELMESLATQCVHILRNAKSHDLLFRETRRLRKELQSKFTYHNMLGQSAKIRDVYTLLERIIPTDARVLIEGESGTGKELIARILHYNGPHKTGPFVAVDCGAFPENLLESELFGYVKGAFTGAISDKPGLFEEAQGGTLFLDEITNMPLNIQSKLLRALQEGEIRPVGSTKIKKVSARIFAAASDNFLVSVDQGKLREDLYYRLNVVNIILPPLRERIDDIPLLVQHFLGNLSKKYKKKILGLKSETLNIMENYYWPGNIRELENIIERMIILAEPGTEYIHPDLLPPELTERNAKPKLSQKNVYPEENSDMMVKKTNFEKKILSEALESNQWNQSSAARELNIPESTLRYKIRKFNIKKM